MISVIGLKTSSSTQMYITNATPKKCVTSSAILLALIASSSRSCQLCADVPVDVSNTNTCNSPSTWRCPLSAREITNKFLRDRQVAVNHREMFCWFSCSWGFKPKKECVDQRNFKNIVDQILPKLFGWTANWTLGSVLLCSVYTIVVLLVVLNCRRALNDDTPPPRTLLWAGPSPRGSDVVDAMWTGLASFHTVATRLLCCICSASPLSGRCGFFSCEGNPFLFAIIVPQP